MSSSGATRAAAEPGPGQGIESVKPTAKSVKIAPRLSDLRTFSDIQTALAAPPLDIVTLLGRIENGRGQEALHHAQAPQVLERLAARTRFDSITASSAIEDVIVDDERALQILRAPESAGAYRNRSELEFAGPRGS